VSEPLAAAAALGRRLVHDAVWHEGRCSWVGVLPEPTRSGRVAPTVASLGGDLYGGTAGVALFLAHLHAVTGDASCGRTAAGAARHALSRAPSVPAARAASLFAGRTGIALAAARCGRLIGDRGLIAGGRAEAMAAATLAGHLTGADLLTGRAGAVAGLLDLGRELDDEELATRARGLAVALAAAPDTGLTGMAHGAAGVAHALRAAGLDDPADAVEAAEDALFDPGAANWPDLRPRGPERAADAVAAGMAWCHGAPGVLLARRGRGRDEAAAAVARWLRAALDGRPGDFSLCHGLAGVAECAADGGVPGGEALAAEVAALGVAEHGDGRPWPCGTPSLGETPGLMLGLAGIGMFMLRREDGGVPSVLAPGPPALSDPPGPSASPTR
jgi:lantibiotic biosynthesis protein